MLTNMAKVTTHNAGTVVHQDYTPKGWGIDEEQGRRLFELTGKHEYSPQPVHNSQKLYRCTQQFLSGNCSSGHRYLKAIVCEREYCPDCGKKNSVAHKRRKTRWRDRLDAMAKVSEVGYMVITVPKQQRFLLYNPEKLKEFRRYIVRKLKRCSFDGVERRLYEHYQYDCKRTGKVREGRRFMKYDGIKAGLVRFHWFGDCTACKGKGCRVCAMTGMGSEFHPHLNILLQGGKMEYRQMKAFKTDVAEWMKRHFNAPDFTICNMNYQYSKSAKQHNHWLNYVTRATFRQYNYTLAKALKGFRNNIAFRQGKVKTIPTAETALEKNLCKCCLEQDGVIDRVHWSRELLPREKIRKQLRSFTRLKDGYFIKTITFTAAIPTACKVSKNTATYPTRC